MSKKELVKYCSKDAKETYVAYSIKIIEQLNNIKEHTKTIHQDVTVINYGHVRDLARISCDLSDIQNYL